MAAKICFADRLQALLDASGMTAYALAKRAGLSKQAVSRLLAGTPDPAWETVQRLARALGTDCTAFADDELEMPEETPARPRGRPKKEAPAEAVAKPAGKNGRKRKGG